MRVFKLKFFDLPFYFVGGVFPKIESRSSKFKCKGHVDGTHFQKWGVPPGWGQIDKAFMNLITN